ncbi:MAG: GDSL-type esterase/lipase family protein [Bacteroidota bacterium]|nr:GDSL-type esterase/lipase family protein [Bacteroidota bacterium]
MKHLNFKIFGLAILLFLSGSLNAQQSRYYKDFLKFKKQDSISTPPKNAILFIGSSSFTKWADVQAYFPGFTIINRAFGGSTLPEVNDWVKNNITTYKPKQVVIYCGENDLASSDTVTPQVVLNRFQQLLKTIRTKSGNINVTYVSIKPSPIRKKIQLKVEQSNELIRKYLKTTSKTAFVDVYPLMIKRDRVINGEIFTSDSLHMNAKGYSIWKKAILPYLHK